MSIDLTAHDLDWLLALLRERPSEDVIRATANALAHRKHCQLPEALLVVRRLLNIQDIPEAFIAQTP
jgi:hypothetical protein